jgi:hypothetical protein
VDDEADDIEEQEDEDGDLSPLVEAAVALHEVYLALIEGGFDEFEAIRILALIISEQGIE